jgi:hypothetical protein
MEWFVWPFMKREDTLRNHNPPIRCWPRIIIKTYRVQASIKVVKDPMWKGRHSARTFFTLHAMTLIAPLGSKTSKSWFYGRSYKVRYIVKVLRMKPISDPCNREKVLNFSLSTVVATPLWGKCEVATHTPEIGTWESSETFENSELDRKDQNTSHWGVLYTIGKVLKCRCPKWPRMSHLDICSTSYGRKKGRESNWEFDSRPLKVRNRPDPGVCRWSATHRWKALNESYKFALDLVPIESRGEKLWMPKVPWVQTGTVSELHFGSPGKKCHLNAGAAK